MTAPKTEYAGSLSERVHRAAQAMPCTFRTEIEFATRARKACLENGILITHEIVDVKQASGHTLAKSNFLVAGAGLTGTPASFCWYSEARDSGDDGISKCATMAQMEFFRALLMVPGRGENKSDTKKLLTNNATNVGNDDPTYKIVEIAGPDVEKRYTLRAAEPQVILCCRVAYDPEKNEKLKSLGFYFREASRQHEGTFGESRAKVVIEEGKKFGLEILPVIA